MKFGEWIPMWLDIYKQGTIKQGSYRQLKNLENLIPDDLKQMEIGEILPLHLQRFIRDFAASASKSYMLTEMSICFLITLTGLNNFFISETP